MFNYARQLPFKRRELNVPLQNALNPLRLKLGDGIEDVKISKNSKLDAIQGLEEGVSILQAAQIGMHKILLNLNELKTFLFNVQTSAEANLYPESVINNFIQTQVKKIRRVAKETCFNNVSILDGSMGVTGITTNPRLKFVRGSRYTLSSGIEGYPIYVQNPAERSRLVGSVELTEELIKIEEMISIFEGAHVVHYRFDQNENETTLVDNLQKTIFQHGLDVTVLKNHENKLVFIHNQFGTETFLGGVSYKTELVSPIPGQTAKAKSGRDLMATIGDEPTIGRGSYMIGLKDNPSTDGLILYYDGHLDYRGQMVGRVIVSQNGRELPNPFSEQRRFLSVPSLLPEELSVGVFNHCGFSNLGELKGGNDLKDIDSLRLIIWAIENINEFVEELKNQENEYVDQAIEMLKTSMSPTQVKEKVLLSKNKALQMAEDIKGLLLPDPLINREG